MALRPIKVETLRRDYLEVSKVSDAHFMLMDVERGMTSSLVFSGLWDWMTEYRDES